ncbi:MAG: hypothetical protein IR153_04020 [Flavobacterium sp.]|nr:hypothetical protein [Flavobacterium sp.]
MKSVVKNIFAVIAGLLIGSIVNGAIIMISGHVIPPPEGENLLTAEGLKASMAMMQPKHFIMPFLAHALGTFVGALIATKIASSRKFTFAMIIGGFFFLGGLANVLMLPSPLWYTVVDLVFAYFPMSYLAYKLITKNNVLPS